MDISKSILYRGLEMNGVTLETGRTLRGISVESVDYSVIETVGYTEKRAGSDGMHASDVYLGARQVSMGGHIYGHDLADMFDFLHTLRSVFSPTSAYQFDPGSRGFLPMHFFQSTHDLESFPAVGSDPAGLVPLLMYLRPLRPPNFAIARDRQDRSGPNHGKSATATPWSAQLFAKDPRVYIDPGQFKDVSGGPWGTGVAATAMNRGDYETPMNIMLRNTAATAGTFQLTGLNGIDMKITLEAKANVVYRWFGDDRVLMTEDVNADGTSKGSPLVLRMDLVTFTGRNRKPMVTALINPPVKPHTVPYRYAADIVLGAGSRLFWSEAFA